MFYTYNKSNNFYYYNIEKDKHVFIGDKTKFINFLAKTLLFIQIIIIQNGIVNYLILKISLVMIYLLFII